MVLQAIVYTPAPAGGGSSSSSSGSLKILDQLALPHRTTYIAIESCEDAHAAIKQMRVRGAPAIAIVAALALAVEVSQKLHSDRSEEEGIKQSVDHIEARLAYLMTSRPTAVNLGDAVRRLSKVVDSAAAEPATASPKSITLAYIHAAEQMLISDVSDNRAIGEHGARWIATHTAAGRSKTAHGAGGELTLLTHCNTGSLATAGYGTALGVIRSLRAAGLLTHAYCTETRPYNQGSRLTAYELVHDEIPATLITDSMAGALMRKQGEGLAAVVVGADRVAANGDTANKIGTYALAVLARYHGVKFLVAAPRTTIDLLTPSGKGIVIEERAAEEVTRIRGPVVSVEGKVVVDEAKEPVTVSTAAVGINVWNPAFDVTPAELIDGVITELGVVEKNEKGVFDFLRLFQQDR